MPPIDVSHARRCICGREMSGAAGHLTEGYYSRLDSRLLTIPALQDTRVPGQDTWAPASD